MRDVLVLLFLCVAASSALEFPWTEWKQLERTPAHTQVNFTIAMKMYNLDVLDELTERLSSPLSPEYRQWKTMEELNDLTRPPVSQVKHLQVWLARHKLHSEDYGDFLSVSGRTDSIEAAFQTEYYAYQNIIKEAENIVIHRSHKHPIIPTEFENLISFITGVSNFPFPTRSARPRVKPVDRYFVVPQTLRNQYAVPSDYVGSNSQNSQGLVEFGVSAGVSIPDLQHFMNITGGDVTANLTYTVGNFNYIIVSPIDMESTLDVQYIMAMAPGVPTAFFVVDGWIYDFTTLINQRLVDKMPVPNVFSMSYAWAEGDQCDITHHGTGCSALGGTSQSYVQATNVALQKIALTGVSMFVAAGDAGAATKVNKNCRKTPVIQPDYPAASPWVMSVGGTMFRSADVLSNDVPSFCMKERITCAGSGEEVVSQLPDSDITTGGGFSNVAPTPSYQKAQVAQYLSSGALLPPATDFNSTGRAYPDITALAHHYMIVEWDLSVAVDGTSASSPVVAALFSLINDNILNGGGSPIGLANPAVYQAFASQPTIGNDIIYGNNTTTEKSLSLLPPCTTPGYGATQGWDAVSGIGSPNYPQLLQALMA